MARVYISAGSNQNRETHLGNAVRALRLAWRTVVVAGL